MQILTPFPRPETDEVHIHCCALAGDDVRYLSPDEQLRADRLLDPLKADRFRSCRGLLREILGRYLGVQPDTLHFAEGEYGKPYLCDRARNILPLHFNLSHAGSMFLLAVAADREVGIDIEQIREDTPVLAMARLAFSPCEQQTLSALPVHQQRSAFYRCWTRKEACMKACGMGFNLQSNSFTVSLLPETPVSLFLPGDTSQWLLLDIPVPENYCATLAVQGTTPRILTMV